MNRAERRAMQFSSPAAHLRHTKTVVQLSAPKIVMMRNATSEPMQALKDWIDTYDDPDAPAMSEQILVELSGIWLGFTRGLWLAGTPWPRDEERHGNNLMSRLHAGAVLTRAELSGHKTERQALAYVRQFLPIVAQPNERTTLDIPKLGIR